MRGGALNTENTVYLYMALLAGRDLDNKSCLVDQFNCDLKSGLLHCIPKSKLCDGPLDCPNDFDEVGCPLIIQEFDIVGKLLHVTFRHTTEGVRDDFSAPYNV